MNDLVMFVARRAAIIRIVAFSSTEGDRHLGIRPVSQLNTWPVVSPVNASRRPSRDAAHHSGSGRLAKPSPWGTSTSYSLPAFLAHSELGHLRRFDPAAMTSDLAWVADIVSGSQSIRSLPNHVDYVSCRRTNGQRQLFFNRDKALLVRAIPVWKGTAVDVNCDAAICLIYRICSEVSYRAVGGFFVFIWGTLP